MRNPGLFWPNYVECEIETAAKNWKVQRKEADFHALRKAFCKLYPGYIVPPLPKNLLTSSESADLNKRKRALQRFLDDTLTHPVLSGAAFLKTFLEAERAAFEAQNKTCENMNPPKSVAECITISGTATVSFDHALSQTCSKISDSALVLKDHFKS